MKKIFLLPVLLVLCLILTSCVTGYQGRGSKDSIFIQYIDKYSPGFVERYKNTQNVKKLKNGMTKEEVYKIMGEPLMYEQYARPNIWFYYTDWDWADCAKTKSEMTPLVFEKGKLAGWGRSFYTKYSHIDWLFNKEEFFDKYKLEE